MAPSFVLLERDIYITPDDSVSSGGSIRCPWEGRNDPPTRQEMTDVATDYLRTFKPHAVVADPPELSSLLILRPKSIRLPTMLHDLTRGTISSADNYLVALYAGGYRPGSSSRLPGGYLIYDATKDSFSVIPEIPSDDSSQRAIGYQSAVVMCQTGGDDYVLGELVRVRPGASQGALWLWRSSAQEWVLQPGCLLPLPSTATHHFFADLCFPYRGSMLCWVDLLQGMVLCDLDQGCKSIFVPLPQDCPTYDSRSPKFRYHACVQEFRSMACVRGDTIRFVALDERAATEERHPGSSSKGPLLELTVWTLSSDLSAGWTVTSRYDVENIWANEAYRPTGIPRIAPMFPVLSIHEDGVVVYLVLDDLRDLDPGLEYLGQSLLRVDMDRNEVRFYPQSSTKSIIHCQLFATEFSKHRIDS